MLPCLHCVALRLNVRPALPWELVACSIYEYKVYGLRRIVRRNGGGEYATPKCPRPCDSIVKHLEYDKSNSDSSFDDDIQDPDYLIIENGELGGILAFDSDPDDNYFKPFPTTPSGSFNNISELTVKMNTYIYSYW